MATELVKMPPSDDAVDVTMRSKADVIARATRIKQIQESLMKEHVHYGTIPGTSKPTLYQPGADLLCVTFRIAPTIGKVDDLSSDDERRYRITVAGTNQATGEILGEGIGECSSDEERYKWRRATCDAEWTETAVDRRREKWSKGAGGKLYQTRQIRTQIADVSNTILKMAAKRAKVAMTLNVTAASDVFQQDLEDLTQELRDEVIEQQEREKAEEQKATPKPAARIEKPAAQGPARAATTGPRETVQPEPPASVPAPAATESPTGHIRTLHERGGGAVLVELDTEFVCSTRDPKLIAELVMVKGYDPAPVVTLKTRDSSDPDKYAPILVSFTVQDGYVDRG